MNVASVGHQCPDCVALGRKTQRSVRTVFGGSTAGAHGYVTISLIVINALMLVVSVLSTHKPGQALGGGGLGGVFGGNTPLSDRLSVVGEAAYGYHGSNIVFYLPSGIADGQYYRLVTAMFIHYGLIHLALNMYALWVMGRPLEAMLGPVRFLAIYLICGIGGNVAAYVFSPSANSAGASTALFGLFGVFFFVLRKLGRSAAGIVPVLVINLIITISVPGISIAGHIGGLITGAVIGYGISRAPQARRTQVQTAVLVGVVLILGVITVLQTVHLHSLTPPV
jgi:membrane associated rhomboid family serine protease